MTTTEWTLQSAAYENVSIPLADLYPTNTEGGMYMLRSGWRAILLGGYGHTLHEYTLSERWSFKGATLTDSHELSALEDHYITGVALDSTASNLFALVHHTNPGGGTYERKIVQLPLSTPGDLSTVGSIANATSFQLTSDPVAMSMRLDGTRVFISDGATHTVHAYDIGAPFSISTTTDPGESLDLGSSLGVHAAVSGDGLTLVASGAASGLYEYTLSTAFSLTGGAYSGRSTVTATTGTLGPAFRSNGTRLYLLSSTPGSIEQYSLVSPVIVQQQVQIPVDLGFGSDFSTPNGDMTLDLRRASGRECLVQALVRRLGETKGTIPWSPSYGFNLSELVNETDIDIDGIREGIETELLSDERVKSCSATVIHRPRSRQLQITIRIVDALGPFTFTLLASDVTVELLSQQIDTTLGI